MITLLTNDLLWAIWMEGSNNICTTFRTLSLKELSLVTLKKSLFMSLIWMFSRNRERIFYIEGKFLFNNLKWLPCYFTLNNSGKTVIDISSSGLKSYYSFIILRDRERLVIHPMIRRSLFFTLPFQSLCF